MALVQTEAFGDLFDRENHDELLEKLPKLEERYKQKRAAARALAINMLVNQYMTCPAAAKKTKKDFDKHMAAPISVVQSQLHLDLKSLPKQLQIRLAFEHMSKEVALGIKTDPSKVGGVSSPSAPVKDAAATKASPKRVFRKRSGLIG